jgi:uncharacterized phage protein gp47/JayE
LPFIRPNLSTLTAQALADITTAPLPISPTLLQRSVLRVLAMVQARFALDHYSYLDKISQNAVPFTATAEYLEGWAALKGVMRNDATPAIGTAIFALSGTVGTVIPAGTTITRADGFSYTTNADATFASSTVTTLITATVSGSLGDAPAGIPLTISGPIANVVTAGTSGVITGGTDIETDDAFRSRMLAVYAAPAQGGSQSDFQNWALAVPGVTRAWCLGSGSGPGTVNVYTMFDVVEAAYGGYPQGSNGGAAAEARITAATGDQLAVANAIYPLRPVTSLVYSLAPTPQTINVTIANLTPSTTIIKAGIASAIADLFVSEGTPLGGLIYPSDISQAIQSVAGVLHFNLTVPNTVVSTAVGSLPQLGTVTYT